MFGDRGSDIVERQSGGALGGVTHVCMGVECVGEDCGSGEGGVCSGGGRDGDAM